MLKTTGWRVDLSSPFVDVMLPDGSGSQQVPVTASRPVAQGVKIVSSSCPRHLFGLQGFQRSAVNVEFVVVAAFAAHEGLDPTLHDLLDIRSDAAVLQRPAMRD